MRLSLRALRTVGPLAVSGLLLFELIQMAGYGAIAERLQLIPLWSVLASLCAVLAMIWVGSCRYALVIGDLTKRKPPVLQVLGTNLLTLFLTYLLPVAALADLARIGITSRLFRVSTATSIRCVIHDRILALVGFAVSAALLTPLLAFIGADWRIVSSTALVAALVTTAIGACMTLARPPGVAAPRLWHVLYRHIRPFQDHLAGTSAVVLQLACAAAITLLMAGQIYFLAQGLGVKLPIFISIAYAPLIALAQVVPFVYAGFGTREATMVALLGGVWASPDAALALGLGVGLINLLASLPGALAAGWLLYDTGSRPARRNKGSPA